MQDVENSCVLMLVVFSILECIWEFHYYVMLLCGVSYKCNHFQAGVH